MNLNEEKNTEILDVMKSFKLPSHAEIIEDIENGNIKATEFLALAGIIENALNPPKTTPNGKKFHDELRELVLDEMGENKQLVTEHGYTFEKAEVGTKYDFTKNPLWGQLKGKEQIAANERKAFEKKMKAASDKIGGIRETYVVEELNEETGELEMNEYRLLPPMKTSTLSYKKTKTKK